MITDMWHCESCACVIGEKLLLSLCVNLDCSCLWSLSGFSCILSINLMVFCFVKSLYRCVVIWWASHPNRCHLRMLPVSPCISISIST